MAHVLTTAGIKLCLSLGILNPTPELCTKALFENAVIPVTLLVSIPGSSRPEGEWDDCIGYEIYDIYDGTKGTSWFCYRKVTIQWLPEHGAFVYTDKNGKQIQ